MKWYQTTMPRIEEALYVAGNAAGWTFLFGGMLLSIFVPVDTTRLILDGAVLVIICQSRQIRRLERIRQAVVNTFTITPNPATVRDLESVLRKVAVRRSTAPPCS